MTTHYEFQNNLKAIWEKAVRLYAEGNKDSSTYFNAAETDFLDSIGHTAQEVFDFAEDYNNSQDPDLETFLIVASLRRFYFQNVMKGQKTGVVVDTKDLPGKDLSVKGIDWLPRIIPKARAKLRGEMSDDLMYGCGGDRKFFKANNLHPADLLAFVMLNFNDDDAIIDFVVSRSKTAATNEVN